MQNFVRYFLTLALSVFLLSLGVRSWAAESPTVDTGYVNAQLVSTHEDVRPGQTLHVALRTQMDPKWHVYWLNPGDSGEPVQISWDLPAELSAADIIWPLPEAIPTGPLMNYGFENEVFFPVEFTVSDDAKPGDILPVKADVFYLVCSDICVPEQANLELNLMVGEPVFDTNWNEIINIAIDVAPDWADVTGRAEIKDDQLVVTMDNLPEGDFSKAYLFPEDGGFVEHAAPQTVVLENGLLTLKSTAGFEWKNGAPEISRGVLAYDNKSRHQGVWVDLELIPNITAATGDGANTASESSGSSASSETSAGTQNGSSDNSGFVQTAAAPGSIWSWALLAFAGGLILNIMPCVFPIISLKALSIAKSAHGEMKTIRQEAWAYTLGIMVSFLLMAAVVLGLKAAGSAVGWAFHFQDPRVVALLAILLFVIGLNLMGVFEVAGGFQNMGQGLTQKSGLMGSFFTGVLAVIVATPCMAPFMGGSVGVALSQTYGSAAIIFIALGLGFALPFLIIAYIPAVSRMLPKPGPWMVTFKEFLAFPMFGAAIWLVWVLNGQAGGDGLWKVLTAMALFGFAIWLIKRSGGLSKLLSAAAILAALALAFTIYAKPIVFENTNLKNADGSAVFGAPWSHENVDSLRADGHAVFVDFTANWCITCKANEITVLKTDEVKQAFKDTDTAFLIADWTVRNDKIARELEKYNRAGIPLYLLFPPLNADGSNKDVMPEILPQTLTKTMVIEALQGINK